MIVYLLKFVACSGILLLFYHFVLQSDRLFKFNRVFLLSIVGLALLIPFTKVRTNYIEIPVVETSTYEAPVIPHQSFATIPQEEFVAESTESFSLSVDQVLIASYLLITILLLVRFGRNLYAINRLKKGCRTVQHSGIDIVLRSDISTSFSFLNHMFTNKERYKQGNLPEEIIQHEKLHIKQHHSIDIIFIELLQCLFWFNPFIYLIRKAIKLNHEFLADAFVIGENTSAYNYQKILLEFTGKHLLKSPLLASNLNYGFTKKRLNMMVKNTKTWVSVLKQSSALLLITLAFWSLGLTKTVAQEAEQKPIFLRIPFELPAELVKSGTDTISKGVSRATYYSPFSGNAKIRYTMNGRLIQTTIDQLAYEDRIIIIEENIRLEYYNKTKQEWKPMGIGFKKESPSKNEEDHTLLMDALQDVSTTRKAPKIISLPQMNEGEPKYGVSGLRGNNRIRFKNASGQYVEKKASELTESELKTFLYPEAEAQWYRIAPPVRKLKQEHLDDFLSPTKYGVWLDGKRVENEVLKNYKPEDIHHYNKSALTKNAKNYGKHTFQVGLTTVEGAKTNSYYQTGWASFHRQWWFTVKVPDIVPQTAYSYRQGWIRPSSTVRYISKAGQLVEKVYNTIEKDERKWLEHPDRKVEVLLPKVEKAEFTQAVLDKYQDSKKYGIWVNDKKINNSELMNYAIDDFHHLRVFNLSDKSRAEKGHNYQVIFYTNDAASKLPSANDRWITIEISYNMI